METLGHTRGGLVLGEIAQRHGGVRALARRIATEKVAGTISRHITGDREPTLRWLRLYQSRLKIDANWFGQPPTRAQMKKVNHAG